MRNAALADMLLGDSLRFLDGEGRGTVRADVAELNQSFDLGAGSRLRQDARTLDIGA